MPVHDVAPLGPRHQVGVCPQHHVLLPVLYEVDSIDFFI